MGYSIPPTSFTPPFTRAKSLIAATDGQFRQIASGAENTMPRSPCTAEALATLPPCMEAIAMALACSVEANHAHTPVDQAETRPSSAPPPARRTIDMPLQRQMKHGT